MPSREYRSKGRHLILIRDHDRLGETRHAMADPRITENEVILEGWVYNLRDFAAVHPGGPDALKIFGGSDATIHYYMMHPHLEMRSKALEPFKLRKLEDEKDGAAKYDIPFIINSKSYQDLKIRVKKAIPYPFATWDWHLKAWAIFGSAVFLEFHSLWFGPSYLKSLVLGVIMAMIGLCIQHDANHGAISSSGWVNRLWGYTQDWIGGSALLWQHHHVLMHHAYTNIDQDDPDITGDLIRFQQLTKWQGRHKWQAIYTWFLLPLLGLKWHFVEILDLSQMIHLGRPMSKMAAGEARLALWFRAFFILRFYLLPLCVRPSLHTLSCYILTSCAGSFYLGINFIISHNFEGVRNVLESPDRKAHVKRDWASDQVETSCTVGGRILGFFHGGLNFQIEHHLFPRISHVHYPKLAVVVRQWCSDNKICYRHFQSFVDNLQSTYKHLELMGRAEKIHTGRRVLS